MAESVNHHNDAISPPNSLLEADDQGPNFIDESELDSTSLSASITDWEFENGRRYHGYRAGSYPIPNDDAELDRIDLKHHVFKMLCGGVLHFAPLSKPKKILDIGTGTGIWVIDMADEYPDASIVGTDLSPVQPQWVPDNAQFLIDDFEEKQWSWPKNHFDYIHSRFLIGSVGDWAELVKKAYKHLKPGGYFELQEIDCRFQSDDGSLSEDSALRLWSDKICEASAKYNRPIPQQREAKPWFEKAGFVNITQHTLKSPSNTWPKNRQLKEISKFQLSAHFDGLESVSLALFTRALKWKEAELKILLAKMRPELKNRSIHSYQIHYVVVGRKPLEPPSPISPQAASFVA